MQIAKELKDLINTWLSGKETRSLLKLSLTAKVSYSTVRRVMQGDCKSVDFTNAFSLLQVLCTWDETLDVMQKYYPETTTNIRKMAADLGVRDNISMDLEQALLDYEQFTIISLAGTNEGTTPAIVADILGRSGLHQLDELVQNGILIQENDRIKLTQERFASVKLSHIIAQIQHSLRFLRRSDIGMRRQHANLHSWGVDRQGEIEIHEIMQRAREEVDAVMVRRSGSIPVFTGFIMGSFKPSEESK